MGMEMSIQTALSVGLALAGMAVVGWFTFSTMEGSVSAADAKLDESVIIASHNRVQASLSMQNLGPSPITKVIPVISVEGNHYLMRVSGLPAYQYDRFSIQGEVTPYTYGYDSVDKMAKYADALFKKNLLHVKGNPDKIQDKAYWLQFVYEPLIDRQNFKSTYNAIPNDDKITVMADWLNNNNTRYAQAGIHRLEVVSKIVPLSNERFEFCNHGWIGTGPDRKESPDPDDNDCQLKRYFDLEVERGDQAIITVLMEAENGEQVERIIPLVIK